LIALLLALALTAPTALAAPLDQPIPDNPCPEGFVYVMSSVRRGETSVGMVAARLRISPQDLAVMNEFKPGQRLVQGQRVFFCRDERPGSVGRPWRGNLRGGVNIDANGDGRGCGWVRHDRRVHTWGTPETVAAVSDCLCRYRLTFPDGPDVSLGDLSRREGRRLSRHRSHQSGRDVDLGFITNPPQTNGHFNRRASYRNLDVEKQWWLVQCFIDRGDLKYIFIANTPLVALRKYVGSRQDLEPYLDYFPGGSRPILSGDRDHRDHIHLRFVCPADDSQCSDRR